MRFEVGELAKFVVARTVAGHQYLGSVAEVTHLNPREGERDPRGNRTWAETADYGVLFPGAEFAFSVMDYQLQKLNPPDEPVEMTHHEEVEA